MQKIRYLTPTPGGRWAISRQIEGEWVSLIEDTSLFHQKEIAGVLGALAIVKTRENINRYFPIRGNKGRCPTLELLELFSEIGTKTGSQIGV